MLEKIILPELGQDIDSATVACWHCSEGDVVSKEDDLLEVVTDKASFNVPSTASGRIKKVLFDRGEDVKVGETIDLIDMADQEND